MNENDKWFRLFFVGSFIAAVVTIILYRAIETTADFFAFLLFLTLIVLSLSTFLIEAMIVDSVTERIVEEAEESPIVYRLLFFSLFISVIVAVPAIIKVVNTASIEKQETQPNDCLLLVDKLFQSPEAIYDRQLLAKCKYTKPMTSENEDIIRIMDEYLELSSNSLSFALILFLAIFGGSSYLAMAGLALKKGAMLFLALCNSAAFRLAADGPVTWPGRQIVFPRSRPRIASIEPKLEKPGELTASEWLENGNKHHHEQNYSEAIRCYSEASRLDPGLKIAHHNLGIVLTKVERFEEAEAAYRKAIEIDPSYIPNYSNLAKLLSQRKRYHEAETIYRNAMELYPSSPQVYNSLGRLLQALERYDDAEAVWRKTIIRYPTHYQAYNSLATLLRLMNRSDDATTLFEKILELDPKDFNPYLGLASINKQLGKSVSSNYLEKARQFLPEDNWYNHACLESIGNNLDLALEYLEKAACREGFDRSWAWVDPDLQWIRGDPRFIEIVGQRPDTPKPGTS